MTLDEARSLIGNAVVYRPLGGPVEQGVITSVNDYFVFVRYGADTHSKATPAGMLGGLIGNADRESSQEISESQSGTLFYETAAEVTP